MPWEHYFQIEYEAVTKMNPWGFFVGLIVGTLLWFLVIAYFKSKVINSFLFKFILEMIAFAPILLFYFFGFGYLMFKIDDFGARVFLTTIILMVFGIFIFFTFRSFRKYRRMKGLYKIHHSKMKKEKSHHG